MTNDPIEQPKAETPAPRWHDETVYVRGHARFVLRRHEDREEAVSADYLNALEADLAASQKRIEDIQDDAETELKEVYARAQAAEAERDRYRAALEEIRRWPPTEGPEGSYFKQGFRQARRVAIDIAAAALTEPH